MDKEKLEKIRQRNIRKDELDAALVNGVLTLEALKAISPTETSSEHHQTLVRALSNRATNAI